MENNQKADLIAWEIIGDPLHPDLKNISSVFPFKDGNYYANFLSNDGKVSGKRKLECICLVEFCITDMVWIPLVPLAGSSDGGVNLC